MRQWLQRKIPLADRLTPEHGFPCPVRQGVSIRNVTSCSAGMRLAQTGLALAELCRRIAVRHRADWKLRRVLVGMDQADRDRAPHFGRVDDVAGGAVVVRQLMEDFSRSGAILPPMHAALARCCKEWTGSGRFIRSAKSIGAAAGQRRNRFRGPGTSRPDTRPPHAPGRSRRLRRQG